MLLPHRSLPSPRTPRRGTGVGGGGPGLVTVSKNTHDPVPAEIRGDEANTLRRNHPASRRRTAETLRVWRRRGRQDWEQPPDSDPQLPNSH